VGSGANEAVWLSLLYETESGKGRRNEIKK
jgi:hypothetical protein